MVQQTGVGTKDPWDSHLVSTHAPKIIPTPTCVLGGGALGSARATPCVVEFCGKHGAMSSELHLCDLPVSAKSSSTLTFIVFFPLHINHVSHFFSGFAPPLPPPSSVCRLLSGPLVAFSSHRQNIYSETIDRHSFCFFLSVLFCVLPFLLGSAFFPKPFYLRPNWPAEGLSMTTSRLYWTKRRGTTQARPSTRAFEARLQDRLFGTCNTTDGMNVFSWDSSVSKSVVRLKSPLLPVKSMISASSQVKYYQGHAEMKCLHN